MHLSEQHVGKLLELFKLGTCAFISPEVSLQTVETLKNRRASEFFSKLGLRPHDLSNAKQALATFNAAQEGSMRALDVQHIPLKGTITLGGATSDLGKVGTFYEIKLADATTIARSFYQPQFVFGMRGNFYLYTSKDLEHYSIADSVHALTDTIMGKKFSISLKDDNGHSAQGIGESVVLPGGVADQDQASMELQVWMSMACSKIETGQYRDARGALQSAMEILDRLAHE